ncbi:MAG: glycoside hydrolase family 88 protein [Clostridiales bacterium]|nr:glycoside hydrolase family 88 protein [Clostridiales bacterium]
MRCKYTPLTDEEALAALDRCVRQVRCNLPLYTNRCQNHTSVDGIYPTCDNVQWTCGFWPGEIWLAYERTGENRFREAGLTLVDSFHDRIVRKVEVDHHDMGFLYSPSCVAAWRLTGSERAREAAILAADQLLTRFQPRGEFLQAWGPMGAAENRRFIIDCLLNIPLLYWAGRETGDPKYADIAGRHAKTCLAHSFRPDGSTYHTFFMNADGTPSHGETCQGYRDDSFWARGQAWGVYGSILSFRYTKDPAYLTTFRKALGFYLTRLPEDRVPYWDMIFSDGSDEPRDSSAAAIVACGLLEARRWLPAGEAARCETLAREMLGSLAQGYAVPEITPGTGLLLHGTYSKKSPYNTCTPEGVDECTGWGDYFYLEALTRLTRDWYPYW